MPEISELRGEAAGVPYVALPPDPAVDDALVDWFRRHLNSQELSSGP